MGIFINKIFIKSNYEGSSTESSKVKRKIVGNF
jgi:hypothetical protein